MQSKILDENLYFFACIIQKIYSKSAEDYSVEHFGDLSLANIAFGIVLVLFNHVVAGHFKHLLVEVFAVAQLLKHRFG